MIRFILNNKEQSTDLPPGMLLLDFVRYHKNLTGTKIGCREGDCGACTVLIGELKNEEIKYRSYTSCLTPLGNIHGKHVVTIEGINTAELNPVQKAMTDCSATQCGFCTPGFVMSLTGFCLEEKEANQENAIAAISGNICRCTGYKSIERAAARITGLLKERGTEEPVGFAARRAILPAYFNKIKEQLTSLLAQLNGELKQENKSTVFVAGGTDLFVQKHDEMKYASIRFNTSDTSSAYIKTEGNKCILGPSVTVTHLQESPVIQQCFPDFNKLVKLVSSAPIRNMATIAGNFINASPIGDFTIFFLALNAAVILTDGENVRELALRDLYKGYKKLNKKPEETIAEISFELPGKNTRISFEKVSKRTHLDIASVNSAIQIETEGSLITDAGIAAGGLGPIPMFLEKTAAYFKGKLLSEDLIIESIAIAQTEISPISDTRGTAEYKRLLLSQLIKAHFLTLFPELQVEKLLNM
jgi:xanthine dehydrogenase small subunit